MNEQPRPCILWETSYADQRAPLRVFSVVNELGRVVWTGFAREEAIARLAVQMDRLLNVDEYLELMGLIVNAQGSWPSGRPLA